MMAQSPELLERVEAHKARPSPSMARHQACCGAEAVLDAVITAGRPSVPFVSCAAIIVLSVLLMDGLRPFQLGYLSLSRRELLPKLPNLPPLAGLNHRVRDDRPNQRDTA